MDKDEKMLRFYAVLLILIAGIIFGMIITSRFIHTGDGQW